MTDIIHELRSAKEWVNNGNCCWEKDADGRNTAPACTWGAVLRIMHAAADEIERLRIELDKGRAACEELSDKNESLECDSTVLRKECDWLKKMCIEKAAIICEIRNIISGISSATKGAE